MAGQGNGNREIRTVGASNYYMTFDNSPFELTELPIKSVTQVSFEGKGTGAQKPIASGLAGRTYRQTTIGGYETSPTITVEVYLSGDTTSASFKLYQWFQSCLPASDGGEGAWEDNRLSGAISLYDPSGDERLRWDIQDAWISKYSLADADVTGDGLAVETYEITAEYIEKITGFSALNSRTA